MKKGKAESEVVNSSEPKFCKHFDDIIARMSKVYDIDIKKMSPRDFSWFSHIPTISWFSAE